MESNRKYKLSFRNTIKFGNKIFKKYFLLFNLVILIYIGVISYFGHYNIKKILDFDRIIINDLFWSIYMFILWIGCLLSYSTNILKRSLIDIIYGNNEDKGVSNLFKIILFTVVFTLMEFISLYLMKIQPLESDHIFYLYSMGNFIGCYFGIVKFK